MLIKGFQDIRVYDAFLFNGEFRLLEVRLYELAPVVDKFIIIEFDHSFRGRPKNLTFEDFAQGPDGHFLEPFLDKIQYMPVNSGRNVPEDFHEMVDAWTLEHFQRDAIING